MVTPRLLVLLYSKLKAVSMSDNLKRYRTIAKELSNLYPGEPKGNHARHLNTLAALISGIVGSRSSNLPAIAGKTPDRCKRESRVKRFSRWIDNERIDMELFFIPYALALLEALSEQTLLLVMDGSTVGRRCITLMVSVLYKRRALPLSWIVVEGKKGHFPEELHVELLERVHDIVPQGCSVVFLGDGEFDGITFQATHESYCLSYR